MKPLQFLTAAYELLPLTALPTLNGTETVHPRI